MFHLPLPNRRTLQPAMNSADEAAPPDARHPKWFLILRELRAPFVSVSLVPVLLGTALAFAQTRHVDWALLAWAVAGTALLHGSANVMNGLFDHLCRNETATDGPVRMFTGGSAILGRGLLSPTEVLWLGLSSLTAGGMIGVYLSTRVGGVVLLLGFIGCMAGIFYSAPPLALVHRGLGGLVIGLNGGVLPVIGGYVVQRRCFSWEAVLLSLPVAILIGAAMLVNHLPAYRPDAAGRERRLLVRLGRERAVTVYAALMTAWMIPLLGAILLGVMPALAFVALLLVIPALRAVKATREEGVAPDEPSGASATTIRIHLALGVIMIATLLAPALFGIRIWR